MKQKHIVNLVLAGFFAWAIIITAVTWFAAKASYIEREAYEPTCRNIAHRIVPCSE